VAFRQNTSDQETLWNLGMIVNNVELTAREAHRHSKARAIRWAMERGTTSSTSLCTKSFKRRLRLRALEIQTQHLEAFRLTVQRVVVLKNNKAPILMLLNYYVNQTWKEC
jgi:hypothetical protein